MLDQLQLEKLWDVRCALAQQGFLLSEIHRRIVDGDLANHIGDVFEALKNPIDLLDTVPGIEMIQYERDRARQQEQLEARRR